MHLQSALRFSASNKADTLVKEHLLIQVIHTSIKPTSLCKTSIMQHLVITFLRVTGIVQVWSYAGILD